MATFGFIGTGNMGSAIACAVCKHVPSDQIFLSNRTLEKARVLANHLNCRATDNEAIAESADFIFLGVKPSCMTDLLADIRPILEKRQSRFILVSMAAGLTISDLRERGCGSFPIIRIMPNTPSSVGEGIVFYTSEGITAEEENIFLNAIAGAGRVLPLSEHLMDAGTAVAGCGPAFADLFMEALADGGVACGLPRSMALECAAQLLIGAGRLCLETGKHPAELKDAVCSPGGSTIQGVRALEESGFRGAVMNAVISAYEKSTKLR